MLDRLGEQQGRGRGAGGAGGTGGARWEVERISNPSVSVSSLSGDIITITVVAPLGWGGGGGGWWEPWTPAPPPPLTVQLFKQTGLLAPVWKSRRKTKFIVVPGPKKASFQPFLMPRSASRWRQNDPLASGGRLNALEVGVDVSVTPVLRQRARHRAASCCSHINGEETTRVPPVPFQTWSVTSQRNLKVFSCSTSSLRVSLFALSGRGSTSL